MEVSDGFCKLTGYSRGQLIGLKHDELIAPDTAEIGKPNDPFTMTGCSEGLWLLVAVREPGYWFTTNPTCELITCCKSR